MPLWYLIESVLGSLVLIGGPIWILCWAEDKVEAHKQRKLDEALEQAFARDEEVKP